MIKYGITLCGATVVASVLLTSNRIHADSRKLVEVTPYGLELIQADELEVGPNPPLMCIVDSGIDLSHPEFDASMINGIDNDNRFWEEPMKWDSDGTGHGTQLAGIIAAIGGNNIGIKGVGSFPLYITRAIDDDGESFGTDIQTALQQCVEANSTIILMGAYLFLA